MLQTYLDTSPGLYFHHVSVIVGFVSSWSELEEMLQALKWVQSCLTDPQSQQDVELLLQLLAKDDFRNAYTIYSAVSQQMTKVNPTSPLTVQAQDLCQEVCVIIPRNAFLFPPLKAGSKYHEGDSAAGGVNGTLRCSLVSRLWSVVVD